MTLRSTAKSKEQPETTTSDPPVKPSKGFYNITGNGSYIIGSNGFYIMTIKVFLYQRVPILQKSKGLLYYKDQRVLIRIKGFLYYKNQRCLIL
jgi:hypothetical protein